MGEYFSHLLSVIFLFLIILSCRYITAQTSSDRYLRAYQLNEAGAPIVTSVFQDSKGFIWFGSPNGIYRWDGYNSRIYRHDPNDTNSLAEDPIRSILFEDKSGSIWISTLSQGIHEYSRTKDKFSPVSLYNKQSGRLVYDQIISACLDSSENIWGIAVGHRFFKYDKERKIANIFLADPTDIDNPINTVLSVLLDHSNRFFWIGTAKGLFKFDILKEQYVVFEPFAGYDTNFKKASINSIIQNSKGDYWFGTSSGLYCYDESKPELQIFSCDSRPNSLSSNNILCIADNVLDNGMSIWIFTGDGLDRLNKSNMQVFHYYLDEKKQKFMFSPFIGVDNYEYFDKNGFLWLATDNLGPVMISLKEVSFSRHYIELQPGGREQYDATSFLEDKKGNLWVGTGFGGLFEYDRNLNLIQFYQHDPSNPNSLSSNNIHSIFEDSFGILWVGTENGLNMLDPDKNHFHRFLTTPVAGGLPFVRISDIFQDDKSRLWIGTSQGAYFTDRQDIVRISFSSRPDIPSLYITIQQIFQDKNKNIWFITPIMFGLYCLRYEQGTEKEIINYNIDPKHPESFFTDGAICFHESDGGVFWLGTTRGLYKWMPEQNLVEHFDAVNGLGANFVSWIEEDRSGNLWLSTEHGLIRFNPFSEKSRMVKRFTLRDGLPFENIYTWKFYKAPDGKFYVGGRVGSGNGFYYFHPDSLQDNINTPHIALTDFKVRNESFKLDTNISEKRNIRLKSKQNYFSFEFAALDFTDPEMNQYAYMLEGFDEEWISCGNRRFANYTGVPPGSYTFRVTGCNNDGYWNEEGASIRITIPPPPWKTWWAYTLYAILIAGVLISISWYYLKRQQLKHALEIERLQKEQLSGMDRMKSRFFANISHEFRTPLTLILGPIERLKSNVSTAGSIKDLNIMQRNALRLQRLIDQLLSLSKIEAGQMKLNTRQENIVTLTQGYLQSFESAARQKGVTLVCTAEKQNLPVFIDRDKIEKVLFNLFSNALKYTGEGGRIEVSVISHQSLVISNLTDDSRLTTNDLSANCAVISIKDTGSGISPEHLPHIFDRFYQADDSGSYFQEGSGIGLALAKELVELHHGKIEVQSTPGTGTTFTIYLPEGSSHLKPEELINGPVIREFIPADMEGLATKDLILDEEETESPVDHPGNRIKPLILIVEDNSDMRYYIRSVIESLYHLFEAQNGTEGWEIALNKVPDLVISDVMMPEIDGYELCRKLKTDERTSHIPVILLTAKAAMEDKLEGLETGADDFITKPFQPEELIVRVKNLIRQRELLREKYRKEFEHASLRPEDSMSSVDARFMEKARQVIGKNLANPDFTINEFSSQMYMSRVQLHRKLSALFNLSASEFIRTYRLNAAARLFESKAGNVAQVAYEVGFNNLSYFSKCFRKQFGMKPSEYLLGNSKFQIPNNKQ